MHRYDRLPERPNNYPRQNQLDSDGPVTEIWAVTIALTKRRGRISLTCGTCNKLTLRKSGAKRILVVDRCEVIRIGLRSILEAREEWTVVAEASDGPSAIAEAMRVRPDIVILDAFLPLISCLGTMRQIKAAISDIEILIFAWRNTDVMTREFLKAGARGIVLKSSRKQDLMSAVEHLIERKPFFSKISPKEIAYDYPLDCRNSGTLLSPRECSVIQCISEGKTNKQIAEAFNLNCKTIETHRATAMRKLNLRTTADLIRYAVRNNLVEE